MANRQAVISTDKGDITVELFEDLAPVTAGNFIDLVERGFYDGLNFHRVEPNFVIQGGCPQGTGMGSFVDPGTRQTRYINLEVTPLLKHDAPGTLAMARSQSPNSASCQFYVTLAATPFLDMQYAVFGKVLSGMEVVNAIRVGDKIKSAKMVEAGA